MKYAIITAACLLVLGGSFAVSSQEGRGWQDDGVLTVLRKGQAVGLKEVGGRFEINVMSNGPQVLGHKVIEVGHDFVILADIAGVTQHRIPLYSITAVTVVNVNGLQLPRAER